MPLAGSPGDVLKTASSQTVLVFSNIRQLKFGLVFVTFEQRSGVPDTLDEQAALCVNNLCKRCVTFLAVTDSNLDFYQFMKSECRRDFLHDIFGQALIAKHDDGFLLVCEAAKVFLLRFGKKHDVVLRSLQWTRSLALPDGRWQNNLGIT